MCLHGKPLPDHSVSFLYVFVVHIPIPDLVVASPGRHGSARHGKGEYKL